MDSALLHFSHQGRLATAIGLAITIFSVLMLRVSPVAHAHGELLSSSPRANSVLTNAPDEVVLRMTGQVDSFFSEIMVFDKDGTRVDKQDTHQLDETTLAVTLDRLNPGTYTVAWHVTSVADAHRTRGSFRFIVSGGGRLFLGTGGGISASGTETRPTMANTLARWSELFGLALVGGGIGTLVFVWLPILSGIQQETRARVTSRFRLLILIGLTVIASAMVIDIVALGSANAQFGESLRSVLADLILSTPTGILFIIRLVSVLILAGLWYRFTMSEFQPKNLMLYLSLGLSGLVLLGRSLGGHASTADDGQLIFSIASDFVHLTAASLWIGGLVALVSMIDFYRRLEPQTIGRALPRFSNLAILSVCGIALTGLYNAWLEVGTLQALLTTAYGKVLLVKTGFILPILGLAAINLFGIRHWLSRSLRRRDNNAVERNIRQLGLLARGEIALALVVLAMTAILAHLPLAKDAVTRKAIANEAPMAMPVFSDSQDLILILGVTPNKVGVNTILLELTDATGIPVSKGGSATVQFVRLDGGITEAPIVMKPEGGGRFSARSNSLSIVGTWVARVVVWVDQERPLRVDFAFRVAGPGGNERSVWGDILDFVTGHEPELVRTGPLVPGDSSSELGLALLQQADVAMNQLASLSECNNINGVITFLDYGAPDQMRYFVRGGGETVIRGDRQWYRRGTNPWEELSRGEMFQFPDFHYADDATGVRVEGVQELDGRQYHLVSFYSNQDLAEYVFWIEAENNQVSRLLMNIPPSHYMVSIFDNFNGQNGIVVPDGIDDDKIPVPTIAEKAPCDSYLP